MYRSGRWVLPESEEVQSLSQSEPRSCRNNPSTTLAASSTDRTSTPIGGASPQIEHLSVSRCVEAEHNSGLSFLAAPDPEGSYERRAPKVGRAPVFHISLETGWGALADLAVV